MIIRNEEKSDYRIVEELTRKAFWNLNSPGCAEHFLAHKMREHEDFIPELDFVLEHKGQIIANIMYTKAKITDSYKTKEVLCFGPISVLPEYQRKGYGTAILEHSFNKAIELGYDTIVIFGNPENYICHGFKSGKKYGIHVGDNVFPTALLVKELLPGAIEKGNWAFSESEVFEYDKNDVDAFDKTFEPAKKEYRKSQELFYIYSRSRLM